MEDYDRYMDERGHEACAQMLARNSARDRAERNQGVMHLTEARNIEFGSPEHLAGLSRAALEADLRFVNDRRNELEDACEQLEAENVYLRSCLSDTEEHASMFLWENNQLKEENAKLRELVRDMWHDLQVHGYKVENMLHARYEHRMRELGVQV